MKVGEYMAKRFVTKRQYKWKHKILLSITTLLLTFFFLFNYLYNKFVKKIDNEKVINTLINYNLNTKKQDSIFFDLLSLNGTDFLLKYTLGINNLEPVREEEVSGIEYNYIEDPYESDIKNPVVYIYNTHQTEGYQRNNNASYNITPSVLMASYILRESLNDLGVPSLVETNDISEILKVNQWQYKYSYAASKILVKDAINKNPDLKYFIDLHRDSMSHEITTTTIDGKEYAKILFVIGKDHPGYEENLKFATNLNETIKNTYPTLTRGISIKSGSGVNGIYNQDLSPHTILIELGGQYNNITEVNNTIEILAKILADHVKGET